MAAHEGGDALDTRRNRMVAQKSPFDGGAHGRVIGGQGGVAQFVMAFAIEFERLGDAGQVIAQRGGPRFLLRFLLNRGLTRNLFIRRSRNPGGHGGFVILRGFLRRRQRGRWRDAMRLLREPAKRLLLGWNQQAAGSSKGCSGQSSVQTRSLHQ